MITEQNGGAMNKIKSELNRVQSFLITFPLEKGKNFNSRVEKYLESVGFTLDGQGLGSIEFEGSGDRTEIGRTLQAKFGKNLVYDFILDESE